MDILVMIFMAIVITINVFIAYIAYKMWRRSEMNAHCEKVFRIEIEKENQKK